MFWPGFLAIFVGDLECLTLDWKLTGNSNYLVPPNIKCFGYLVDDFELAYDFQY